ncbi:MULTISPECIES: hypothetical protein [Bacillus]|uniref:hypothetical protein n=1 Tax=Bacillus TaxID=1386 RepID=UPI0002EE8631|nr:MULTISPECIES: hypothetical protein [Bacillus]
MRIYRYSVSKIEGTMDQKLPLEELAKHLNQRGKEGFKLTYAIPQVSSGTTESTVLIFEAEDTDEESAIG